MFLLFMFLGCVDDATPVSTAVKWRTINSPDPSIECYATYYGGHQIICIEKQ